MSARARIRWRRRQTPRRCASRAGRLRVESQVGRQRGVQAPVPGSADRSQVVVRTRLAPAALAEIRILAKRLKRGEGGVEGGAIEPGQQHADSRLFEAAVE